MRFFICLPTIDYSSDDAVIETRTASTTPARFPTHSKFTEFYNTDGDAYKNDFADGCDAEPSGVQDLGGRLTKAVAHLCRVKTYTDFALPLLLSAIPGQLALLAGAATQQSYSQTSGAAGDSRTGLHEYGTQT